MADNIVRPFHLLKQDDTRVEGVWIAGVKDDRVRVYIVSQQRFDSELFDHRNEISHLEATAGDTSTSLFDSLFPITQGGALKQSYFTEAIADTGERYKMMSLYCKPSIFDRKCNITHTGYEQPLELYLGELWAPELTVKNAGEESVLILAPGDDFDASGGIGPLRLKGEPIPADVFDLDAIRGVSHKHPLFYRNHDPLTRGRFPGTYFERGFGSYSFPVNALVKAVDDVYVGSISLFGNRIQFQNHRLPAP